MRILWVFNLLRCKLHPKIAFTCFRVSRGCLESSKNTAWLDSLKRIQLLLCFCLSVCSNILLLAVKEPGAVCWTSFKICGACCKIKMRGLLFKNWEFQDGENAVKPSVGLSWVWGSVITQVAPPGGWPCGICVWLWAQAYTDLCVYGVWAQVGRIAACVLTRCSHQ